jgi:hypothetical protein
MSELNAATLPLHGADPASVMPVTGRAKSVAIGAKKAPVRGGPGLRTRVVHTIGDVVPAAHEHCTALRADRTVPE